MTRTGRIKDKETRAVMGWMAANGYGDKSVDIEQGVQVLAAGRRDVRWSR
jgi:hypothetical protein